MIAVGAKGVNVAVALLPPVLELNAKLEAALHRRQHLALIDLQQLVELNERGDRRFAYANSADGLRLDQCDIELAALLEPRQHRRCHPSCSAPTDDDDVIDWIAVAHCSICLLVSLRLHLDECCKNAMLSNLTKVSNVNVHFLACERSQLPLCGVKHRALLGIKLRSGGGHLVSAKAN